VLTDTIYIFYITRVLSAMKHIHEYQSGFAEHRRPASFGVYASRLCLLAEELLWHPLSISYVDPSFNPADVQKFWALTQPS